jgi:hypothetical protein
MKYIALLYGEPDAGPVPGTPEFMEMPGEFQSATAAILDCADLDTALRYAAMIPAPGERPRTPSPDNRCDSE